jgi:hypothetical protein
MILVSRVFQQTFGAVGDCGDPTAKSRHLGFAATGHAEIVAVMVFDFAGGEKPVLRTPLK